MLLLVLAKHKSVFKFRWTGLTITIFNVKIPWGSYKLTKYAVKLTLYYVQLHGFVPVTKLPKWASKAKGFFLPAYLSTSSNTMFSLSQDFNFPSLSK